jgi:hypothetical protein
LPDPRLGLQLIPACGGRFSLFRRAQETRPNLRFCGLASFCAKRPDKAGRQSSISVAGRRSFELSATNPLVHNRLALSPDASASRPPALKANKHCQREPRVPNRGYLGATPWGYTAIRLGCRRAWFAGLSRSRFNVAERGRDRGTARATLGEGLAVSAFPLYVPV